VGPDVAKMLADAALRQTHLDPLELKFYNDVGEGGDTENLL
jgi:hypothetical protein